MKLKASFLYAFRLLFPKTDGRSNARKSLLGAVFCIALSLVPLVVVLVVSDGMIQGITSRFIELSSYHLQVKPYGATSKNAPMSSFLSIAQDLKLNDEVLNTFLERQSVGLLAGKTGRQGVTIRGIDSALLSKDSSFMNFLTIHDGDIALSDKKSILVGKKIADTLGIVAGDNVRLITARNTSNGNISPRVTTFYVQGVVSCGYQELDALWVFIPVETAFDIIPGASAETIIGIQTENAFSKDFSQIQVNLSQQLPTQYRLFSWKEINSAQYENFASTKALLLFIMFLIVLVASVNVSSALVMLVMERRREIALLKSIGASSLGITTSFIITGFCTGSLGVVLGLPLGLVFAINVNSVIHFIEKIVNTFFRIVYSIKEGGSFISIHLLDPAYYLETIPIVVPFAEIFLIALGTLLLSVLVSIIPSVRAGREKPVDTLRKM